VRISSSSSTISKVFCVVGGTAVPVGLRASDKSVVVICASFPAPRPHARETDAVFYEWRHRAGRMLITPDVYVAR
jgi:hypothetical protein